MPSYGYYFMEDEMPEEFVIACNSLNDGEVSDLIKSSYGYHIIKKLDVDKSDLGELTDVVYNKIFEDIVDEKISETVIEYSPEYEYITPQSLK
jgi:parvulin-like peptidyl-prolyl isomerase